MFGPLFTRIHQAFLHHVMCLFDTSFSSCIEFVSFFSSTLLPRVVPSPSSSCSPLGFYLSFLPLESLCFSHLPFLLFLSLGLSRLSFSLFLSLHFFLSLLPSLRFSLLLLLSPSLFQRLLRSSLLLVRLLRSHLFFSRLLRPSLFFSRLLRPSLLFIFLLVLALRPLLQTWPCLFLSLLLFLFPRLLLLFSFCLLFFFLLSFVVFTVCPSRSSCPFPSFFLLLAGPMWPGGVSHLPPC